MPKVQTNDQTSLEDLAQRMGNSNATSLRGGAQSLSAKGGLTGRFQSVRDRLSNNAEQNHQRAEEQLIAAYTVSTGQPPLPETRKLIADGVRGRGGMTAGQLIAELQQHAATDAQRREQYKANLTANVVQGIRDVHDAAGQRQVRESRVGSEQYERIQSDPHLSEADKLQVTAEVVEFATKDACLKSLHHGNLARHNDACTKFLSDAMTDKLQSFGEAVASKAVSASSNLNLSKIVPADRMAMPSAGTFGEEKGPTSMKPEQLKKVNDHYADCAAEILESVIENGKKLPESANVLVASIQRGVLNAAEERPALLNNEGKVITPEVMAGKLVQSQIFLRSVQPAIVEAAAELSKDQNDPDKSWQGKFIVKAVAVVESFGNGATDEQVASIHPETQQPFYAKPQDKLVEHIRSEKPQLLAGYRQMMASFGGGGNAVAQNQPVQNAVANQAAELNAGPAINAAQPAVINPPAVNQAPVVSDNIIDLSPQPQPVDPVQPSVNRVARSGSVLDSMNKKSAPKVEAPEGLSFAERRAMFNQPAAKKNGDSLPKQSSTNKPAPTKNSARNSTKLT